MVRPELHQPTSRHTHLGRVCGPALCVLLVLSRGFAWGTGSAPGLSGHEAAPVTGPTLGFTGVASLAGNAHCQAFHQHGSHVSAGHGDQGMRLLVPCVGRLPSLPPPAASFSAMTWVGLPPSRPSQVLGAPLLACKCPLLSIGSTAEAPVGLRLMGTAEVVPAMCQQMPASCGHMGGRLHGATVSAGRRG